MMRMPPPPPRACAGWVTSAPTFRLERGDGMGTMRKDGMRNSGASRRLASSFQPVA